MIVVLKHGVEAAKREQLIDWLEGQGLTIHISEGEYQTVLGLVGDTTRVDMDLIGSLGIVDSVKRVTEPFKCCNRKFHPDDTVIDVNGVKLGGGNEGRQGLRCEHPARRRVQAPHLALRFPGSEGHRPRAAQDRAAGDRPAHRDGDHGRGASAPVRGCGHHSGRRAQHAELRPPA